MLMAKRHEADYENFAFIDEQQIPLWIEKTQNFINEIEKLMGDSLT